MMNPKSHFLSQGKQSLDLIIVHIPFKTIDQLITNIESNI